MPCTKIITHWFHISFPVSKHYFYVTTSQRYVSVHQSCWWLRSIPFKRLGGPQRDRLVALHFKRTDKVACVILYPFFLLPANEFSNVLPCITSPWTRRFKHSRDWSFILFTYSCFRYFWTLFAECFTPFDRSTCALSVLCRYSASRRIYFAFRVAVPSNFTRWWNETHNQ